MQAGKRWVFDDEKREVSILPPRTPVVISGVQERFLGFARNDDTGKALSSEPRNLKVGIRDEWLVTRETLRLFPRTVIPSAAEGSPLQAGKRWIFDDEKREVLSLPPRTPVVISGVQERFLGFALFRLWPTPCPSGIPLPWEGGRRSVTTLILWKC